MLRVESLCCLLKYHRSCPAWELGRGLELRQHPHSPGPRASEPRRAHGGHIQCSGGNWGPERTRVGSGTLSGAADRSRFSTSESSTPSMLLHCGLSSPTIQYCTLIDQCLLDTCHSQWCSLIQPFTRCFLLLSHLIGPTTL